MQKRTFGASAKVVAVAVLGFASLTAPIAARGDNVTYLPNAYEGGIYDWRTVGNWYRQGGSAYGRLPDIGDNVRVTNATFATEWLVIPSGVDVSVKSLNLQVQGSASRYGVKMKIDGGSLTTTEWSSIGNQGNDALLSIENGGSWTAGNTVVVGYGGASNCQLRVSSGSTFSGAAMQVHNGGGGGTTGSLVARVDNAGLFMLSGDLTVGYRDNAKESDRRSLFENSGSASASRIYLGRAPQSSATLVNDASGTIAVTNIYVGACTNAAGVFVNNGSLVARSAFVVGDMPDAQAALGQPGASGCVTNNGSITAKSLSFAYTTNSVARLRNNGTLTILDNSHYYLGYGPGSDGEIANYGTLDLNLVGKQLRLGQYGRGRLEVGNNTPLDGWVFMGVGSGGHGELSVTNGATLITTDGRIQMANVADSSALLEVFEDSTLVGVTNLVVGAEGRGVLRLRGGTVTLTDNVGAWMSIGKNNRTADISNGRLEGWGTIDKTNPSEATGTHTVRVNLYNGVVLADGGGAARDLDLRLVQDMNQETAAPNACGTNGWYAANGARLRYPARFHSRGTSRIVGDYGQRAVSAANLPLVNSFGVTFAPSEETFLANKYLYADLYASDRADIPAGLPDAYSGLAALGVWHAALSNRATEPVAESKVAFGSANVLVHYDGAAFAKLKKNGTWPADLKLALYAHDGTAGGRWRKVAEVETSDSPYISATIAESSDTWNMGWFAVVPVKKNGLIITFR